jgi:RNA polymerase sigma-70 factor (ECF subfamily)
MDKKLENSRNTDEQLIRSNISWMMALSNKILNDSSLAQDAVQDAFLDAFNSLDQFEGRSSFKTWLHRITINACLKKLRKTKQLSEISIDEHLPEFDHQCRIEQPWMQQSSVEEIMSKSHLVNLVRDTILELPESYRVVVQLRDIEGYSIKEVADLLNLSESNVKVRLHRARAVLKKLLDPVLRGELT